MTPFAAVFAGAVSGLALGWIYFHALSKTVATVSQRSHPGVHVAVSALLRLAAALTTLTLLARWGGLPALVAALPGFVLVRTAFVRRMRPAPPQGPA